MNNQFKFLLFIVLVLIFSNNVFGSTPSISQIQCNNGTSWVDCSNITYAKSIAKVRGNCTFNSSIDNVTFSLYNLENNQFFYLNISFSTNSSDTFEYDHVDLEINDSGNWTLSTNCFGNSTLTQTNVTWFVPWGRIVPYLISPNSDITMVKHNLQNISTGFTCVLGECNNVRATLDPEKVEEIFEDKEVEDVIIILKTDVEDLGLEDVKEKVKNVQDEVLSTLETKNGLFSEPEIVVKKKYKLASAISANLTKEGYEKLKENPNVEAILSNGIKRIFLDGSVPKINATNAWNLKYGGVNITGSGETVCVIDTGIDYNHSALGNSWGVKVIGGYDYVNNDDDPYDDHGHGTHVAGIVASNDSTYKGVAPDSKLIAMKVCNSAGLCSDAAILSALEWCVDNATKYNISVITMSLGSDTLYTDYCNDDANAGIIDLAVGQNIMVTVASGNAGSRTGIASPACIQNATAIGGTTKTDGLYTSSNIAPPLDFYAPGQSITSANDGGGFVSLTGTSMATPHVAGAAALIYQYNRLRFSRNVTPFQIEDKFKVTGQTISESTSGVVRKRIDAFQSVSDKGDVPMTIGALPFYSLTQNPVFPENLSCLSNMKAGETCNQSWTINATIDSDTTWTFYSKYHHKDVLNITSKFNINVVADLETPALDLVDPVNLYNSSNNSINFNFSIYEKTYTWVNCTLYLNNTLNITNENLSVTASTLSYTNLSVNGLLDGHHSWNVTCRDADDYENTTTSRIVVIDTKKPIIESVSLNNEIIESNSSLIITVNVTDIIGIKNMSLSSNLTFNSTNFSLSNGNIFDGTWTLHTSIIGTNGTYNLNITTYDYSGNVNSSNKTLLISEVFPNISNINVNTLTLTEGIQFNNENGTYIFNWTVVESNLNYTNLSIDYGAIYNLSNSNGTNSFTTQLDVGRHTIKFGAIDITNKIFETQIYNFITNSKINSTFESNKMKTIYTNTSNISIKYQNGSLIGVDKVYFNQTLNLNLDVNYSLSNIPVSLNFTGTNAKWNNSLNFKILTHDFTFNSSIIALGVTPQKEVVVKSFNDFISDEYYYATFNVNISTFDSSKTYFHYCTNNYSLNNCFLIENICTNETKKTYLDQNLSCYWSNFTGNVPLDNITRVFTPTLEALSFSIDNVIGNITFLSPINGSVSLESGENVKLNISVNDNLSMLNISVNSGEFIFNVSINDYCVKNKTNGIVITNCTNVPVNGSLFHNILNNGTNGVVLGLKDVHSNYVEFNYDFLVNDTTPPTITSSEIVNGSVLTSEILSDFDITMNDWTNLTIITTNGSIVNIMNSSKQLSGFDLSKYYDTSIQNQSLYLSIWDVHGNRNIKNFSFAIVESSFSQLFAATSSGGANLSSFVANTVSSFRSLPASISLDLAVLPTVPETFTSLYTIKTFTSFTVESNTTNSSMDSVMTFKISKIKLDSQNISYDNISLYSTQTGSTNSFEELSTVNVSNVGQFITYEANVSHFSTFVSGVKNSGSKSPGSSSSSSSSSSSGGGGGGGGGGSKISSAAKGLNFTHIWLDVSEGDLLELKLNHTRAVLRELKFNALSNVTSLELKVYTMDSFRTLDEPIYKFLKFKFKDYSDVTVRFRVEKTFLENGIGVYNLINDKWEKLTFKMYNSDSYYSYFEVQVSELEYLAITLPEKEINADQVKSSIKTPEKIKTNELVKFEKEIEKNDRNYWILGLNLFAVFVFVYFFRKFFFN